MGIEPVKCCGTDGACGWCRTVIPTFLLIDPGSHIEALLSFSPQDTICIIPLYLAKKNSKRWVERLERATNELLNACLDEGGSYYLTFDIIASKQQFQRAYPQWQEFLDLKRRYDPEEMFTSMFYEKYAVSSAPEK